MLELTCELIEHYLRATGWTLHQERDELAVWNHPNCGRVVRVFYGAAENFGATLFDIGYLDNSPMCRVAFRLGLCAAAERDFAVANNMDVAISRESSDVSANAYASGCSHLRDAGIDPKAWEAARKQ